MTQLDPDDIGHAGFTAAGRSHPYDIVIAPLNVDTVIGQQAIQDEMRTGSAIVNIPHNMQVIDGQALDGFGHDDQNGLGMAGGDNRLNHVAIVIAPIRLLFLFEKQFFNQSLKSTFDQLPNLSARVFR